MLIPLFIAILLGFVNPATISSDAPNYTSTTVNATGSNSSELGNVGENGDPADDGTEGGSTGGEGGHIPIPKP